MNHNHSKWAFWYHTGCPPCKVRQLRYGFRLDPLGYIDTRSKVAMDTRFTVRERLWILDQTPNIQVID